MMFALDQLDALSAVWDSVCIMVRVFPLVPLVITPTMEYVKVFIYFFMPPFICLVVLLTYIYLLVQIVRQIVMSAPDLLVALSAVQDST